MDPFDTAAPTRPLVASSSRRHGRLYLAVMVLWLATGGSAHAFSGVIRYTGALGPVNGERPLRICLFTDVNLQNNRNCALLNRNDAGYTIGLGARDYYLVGFLDIDRDEVVDPDEPYEIFANRRRPPGDPVDGTSTRTDIDFIFGDENLGPEMTPTATATASATEVPTDTPPPSPTATASPTATEPEASPTPNESCGGDCNGDGRVLINELIVVVRLGLRQSPLDACASADTSGDGVVQIGEIIAAVRRSLEGC